MINQLRSDRLQIVWLIFHLFLGALVTYVPFTLILWIYLLAFSTIVDLVKHGNKHGVIHYFLAYYLGMEILSRAVKTSPYVPYESGKYFMTVLLVLGIFIANRSSRSIIGWVVLVLSIPALFVVSPTFTYKDIVFNYLGLLNLALALLYFAKTRIWEEDLTRLIRLCIYSFIPLIISITLKTPDFEDVKFTLGANVKTSGGFGSNQVSTVLALGVTLLGFCYLTGKRVFKKNYLVLGLFFFFFFRALLTFSRGGVVGGIVILILIFVLKRFFPLPNTPSLSIPKTLGVFLLLFFIAIYANNLTNNILFLRYQGETTSTLEGKREKDLSLITSGRYDIFLSDLNLWSENLIFGVGPGASAYMREDFAAEKVNAHVEISRLLSEHGLFGLLISLIILVFPFADVIRCKNHYGKLFKICLFGYAVFSSFHSAMRTNITPFLFGLATIFIIYGSKKEWYKNFIRWKSIDRTRIKPHNNRSSFSKIEGGI